LNVIAWVTLKWFFVKSHKFAMVKGSNIALNERTHLRATERHLSYGITQCYLPPDTGERALPY